MASVMPWSIRELHRGSKTAALLYFTLRLHGIRIPLLLVVAVGMMLAVRTLLGWLMVVAGEAKPW